MALYYNNTSIPQGNHVYINNQDCQKVIYNNVEVWKRRTDYLFNWGNVYSEWTGGWTATPWYPVYYSLDTVDWMDNRNNHLATIKSDCMEVTSAAQNYNGQGIRPDPAGGNRLGDGGRFRL